MNMITWMMIIYGIVDQPPTAPNSSSSNPQTTLTVTLTLPLLVKFMDSAEDELRRDAKDVALPRVQALLQQALATSTLAADPHREDLTCNLARYQLCP